jgi:pyrroloquinoline-quinone synthase
MTDLLSPAALEARLQAIGEERYHIHHPFHRLLHGGQLTKGQVQAWALNRYYAANGAAAWWTMTATAPLRVGSSAGSR